MRGRALSVAVRLPSRPPPCVPLTFHPKCSTLFFVLPSCIERPATSHTRAMPCSSPCPTAAQLCRPAIPLTLAFCPACLPLCDREGGDIIPDELDPKVVEVYQGVGKVLSRYKSGKVRPAALEAGPGVCAACDAMLLHAACACALLACLACLRVACTLIAHCLHSCARTPPG